MKLARSVVPVFLCVLLWAPSVAAQVSTGTVAGRVTDSATRQPIAGAAVAVAERGALTDEEGRYTITGVPTGTHTVRATRIGFAEATRSVTVAANRIATVDIALAPQALALEELVVIGYGQRRAEEVTGSIATVTPEDFNTGRIVSPEQLIQGKVAGVQIIDSGEPGGGVQVRIRGATSVNASNQPLFVVDGVPLPVGGGLSAGRNPLNFLNPAEVENVTVLKDASATAIYGSRGANGVILIETRSGRRSPAQLSYAGSFSGSQTLKRPELLSADLFREAVQEYAPENLNKIGDANTDWQDAVQREASGQEHNIAFAGASDALDYRFSLGYLGQNGVVRGTQTERLSASLNYGHRLLNERLTLRGSIKGSRTDDEFVPGGVIGAANSFAPTQPIRTASGDFYEWTEPLGPNNPVAELELSTDLGTLYRTIGNVEAHYEVPFLSGLSARVRGSYDLMKGERKQFFPSTLQWQKESGIGGMLRRESPTMTNAVVDAFVSYGRPLDFLDSNLDFTGGYSYEEENGDFPSFQAEGLSTDLLGTSGVPAAETVLPFLDIQESKLASFFGRVHYDIQDRYLFTASVRRDGSSRFGPDNRWGTFPSAAFAWRLSEESFLKGRFAPLSDLKLRLSWGMSGNQAFSNYQFYNTYIAGDARTQAQFGDEFVTTIRPSAVDPNIKWEETTATNVGLDYGFLGGRLRGAFDFYTKTTEDLIFRVPVAAGTNLADFVTTNIGSMKNRGMELSLEADLIRPEPQRRFSWNATFNVAHNSNELVRINPFGAGTTRIMVGGISGGVGNNIQILQPGEPLNAFFVYRHKRDADGRPLYEDTNGDGSINELDLYDDLNGDDLINQEDRAPFDSPAPDWILGASSNFGFGSFDAGFSLRSYLGSRVYNNVASNQGHWSALKASGAPINLHASVLTNNFAAPQYFSDVYVEDASFLRLDNVTVGYTLDGVRGVNRMRLFGTVQNAFTLTGYSGVDPMAGINGIDNNIYPRARTFLAGVNAWF